MGMRRSSASNRWDETLREGPVMSLRPWPDASWQKQSEGFEVVAARPAVESELDAGEEQGEGETHANPVP